MVAPPSEIPDYSYMSDEQLAEMCARLESSRRWMTALLGQLNDEKAQLLEQRDEFSGEILKLGGSLQVSEAGGLHSKGTAPEDVQPEATAAHQQARSQSLTPVGISSGNEESPLPGSRRAVEWMRMDQWCRDRLQAEEAARVETNFGAAADRGDDAADCTAERAAGEKVPDPTCGFYARRVAKAQAHAEDCMQRLARAQNGGAPELQVQRQEASGESKQSPRISSRTESALLCSMLPPQSALPALPTLSNSQQAAPPGAAQVAASRPLLQTLGQVGLVLPGGSDAEQASLKLLDQEVQRQKEELELAKRQLEEEMAGFAEGMEARQRVVQACQDEQIPWKRSEEPEMLQGDRKRLAQKEDMDPQLGRADLPDEFENTIQRYRQKAAELEASGMLYKTSRSPLMHRSSHIAEHSPRERARISARDVQVPLPLQIASCLESGPARTDESTSTMATTPDINNIVRLESDVDAKNHAPLSGKSTSEMSATFQPVASSRNLARTVEDACTVPRVPDINVANDHIQLVVSSCKNLARIAECTSTVTVVPYMRTDNNHAQNLDIKNHAPRSDNENFGPLDFIPASGSSSRRATSPDSKNCTVQSEEEMLQPSKISPPETYKLLPSGDNSVVPDVTGHDISTSARSLDVRGQEPQSERKMVSSSKALLSPGSSPSKINETASIAIVVPHVNMADRHADSPDIRSRATQTRRETLRPARLYPCPDRSLSKPTESSSSATFIPIANTGDNRARSLDARYCQTDRGEEMCQPTKLVPCRGGCSGRPTRSPSTARCAADISMTDSRARSLDVRNHSPCKEGEMFPTSKLVPHPGMGRNRLTKSLSTAVILDVSMRDGSARSLDVKSSARHREDEAFSRPQMVPSSGSSPSKPTKHVSNAVILDVNLRDCSARSLDVKSEGAASHRPQVAPSSGSSLANHLNVSTATVSPDVDTRLGTVYARPPNVKYTVARAADADYVVAAESTTQVRIPLEAPAGPVILQKTQRSASVRKLPHGSGSARRHLSAEVGQICPTSASPLRREPSRQKLRPSQADMIEVEGPQLNLPLHGHMPDRRIATAYRQPPKWRVQGTEPLAVTVDYTQTGTVTTMVPPQRSVPRTASQALCVTAQQPTVVGLPSRASTPSAAIMSSTRPLVASGMQQRQRSTELVNMRTAPAPPQRPVTSIQARSLSRESSRSLALSNPPPMFTTQGCLQQPSLSRESTRSGALSTPQPFPQQPAPDAPATLGLLFPASAPGLPGAAMPLGQGLLHTSFSSPGLDTKVLEAAHPREATHDRLLAPLWLGLPAQSPTLADFEAPPPPRTAPASQAPYGSIATLPGEDALGSDPLCSEPPPPPRSAPAAQDIIWDSAPETARDRSRHLGEHLLRVQTADDRWESLAFSSGDDLQRSGAAFLQQQGLKRAFHSGLITKMRQMIAAGESYSSVDVVDLI